MTEPEGPLRIGIVGTGTMGREHVGNVLALDGAVLSALCDPHEPSRAAARDMSGDVSLVAEYEDHRQMLADEACDAVILASPNHTHRDVMLDLLDAPVHVMVEKPLSINVDDARVLYDAALEDPPAGMGHRVVWMGLEYRYMPPTQGLLAEVAAGRAGDVKTVSIREHRHPFLVKVDDWNRFTRNTGGTLVEKCCHFFDLMTLIAGARPERVYASGGQAVNHLDEVYEGEVSDILDHAFVIVDFENGIRGSLDLCMFAEASRNEQIVTVVGDEGKIEALSDDHIVRVGRRSDGRHGVVETKVADPRIRFVGGHHGSSYLEVAGFVDAIRAGAPAEVTLRDGLWSVAVGAAAHRSIDEGRPVMLSEYSGLAGTWEAT